MGTWIRVSISGAAALAALSLAVMPAAGQTPAYRAPRSADGKPNLNGIWQARNSANWDIQGHAAAPGRAVARGAEGAVPPDLCVMIGDEIPCMWCMGTRRAAPTL